MECLRCGNKDPTYFYKGHKGYYCRKCVRFKRILLEEEMEPYDYEISKEADDYSLKYELTKYQKEASRKVLDYLNEGDVLLNCVCGAGKTEIVVLSIAEYLKRGLKVCFAISRREVVIELEKRFRSIFRKARVVGVYGGHHEVLTGDLIVCTNHQLFRYYKTFDLLVLDEVDAFPLRGDETLFNISKNSSRGRIIYSTATVDSELIRSIGERRYRTVELFVRPSLKPLCIPRLYLMPRFILYFCLYGIMRKMTNQCIVFVSRKRECGRLFSIFRNFFSCIYAYAGMEERDEYINDFRNGKYQFIFATSILERGITIKGVNVIVLYDRKDAYSKSALIQMFGRVGRSVEDTSGEAYLLTSVLSMEILGTIGYLRKANSHLEVSLL